MAEAGLLDEIYLHQESQQRDKKRVLLFFIPGNPGLVEYYRDYLSYLLDLLRAQHPSCDVHIYGTSLRGFEVTGTKRDDTTAHAGPYILQDQRAHLIARLERVATKINSQSTPSKATDPLRTIIIGHSVGAWLTLDLTHQHRSQAFDKTSAPSLEIVSSVALFPTVYDLALSPRGRVASPLLKVPGFILFLHYVAASLTLLPSSVLQSLVATCTGMPARGARVTTAFLRSKGGVYQALHLAKDEFAVITSEKESLWSEDLWGGGGDGVNAAVRSQKAPALLFYWGSSDGYVAPATRARVIASRGNGEGGQGKAVMIVDDQGTDHAFCVDAKGNRIVADETARFLENVLH